MVDKQKLIASFQEIIGWPYLLGGTSKNGIDCSGAFVRGYQLQGASIYHGSNTIYRKYCSGTGKISSLSDLKAGMAVFKNRFDNNEPAKYHGDGIGNMYHIGLVCAVNPLRIIHATSPNAKEDTALGAWSYWGKLAAVNYEGNEVTTMTTATVIADSGSTVNLRNGMSKTATIIARVPLGATVTVTSVSGEWAQVQYETYTGYMMSEFLQTDDATDSETSASETSQLKSAIKQAIELLQQAL